MIGKLTSMDIVSMKPQIITQLRVKPNDLKLSFSRSTVANSFKTFCTKGVQVD